MDGLISNLNCMCCDTNMNIEPEGGHTTPPEILVVFTGVNPLVGYQGWLLFSFVEGSYMDASECILLRGRIPSGCVWLM